MRGCGAGSVSDAQPVEGAEFAVVGGVKTGSLPLDGNTEVLILYLISLKASFWGRQSFRFRSPQSEVPMPHPDTPSRLNSLLEETVWYMAAAGAVIGLTASEAHAQIIYTDVDPDVTVMNDAPPPSGLKSISMATTISS